MDTHANPEGVKSPFTLVGEVRLWYESLRPINVDWLALQNQFRQHYSKIGNTREQLFHAWRSFHFDKNTETIDSFCYIHKTGSNTIRLWQTTDISSI